MESHRTPTRSHTLHIDICLLSSPRSVPPAQPTAGLTGTHTDGTYVWQRPCPTSKHGESRSLSLDGHTQLDLSQRECVYYKSATQRYACSGLQTFTVQQPLACSVDAHPLHACPPCLTYGAVAGRAAALLAAKAAKAAEPTAPCGPSGSLIAAVLGPGLP
jgi:hypothetical protein